MECNLPSARSGVIAIMIYQLNQRVTLQVHDLPSVRPGVTAVVRGLSASHCYVNTSSFVTQLAKYEARSTVKFYRRFRGACCLHYQDDSLMAAAARNNGLVSYCYNNDF
jgi:hypothetical protein